MKLSLAGVEQKNVHFWLYDIFPPGKDIRALFVLEIEPDIFHFHILQKLVFLSGHKSVCY